MRVAVLMMNVSQALVMEIRKKFVHVTGLKTVLGVPILVLLVSVLSTFVPKKSLS